MYSDPTGHFIISALIAGVVTSAIVSALVDAAIITAAVVVVGMAVSATIDYVNEYQKQKAEEKEEEKNKSEEPTVIYRYGGTNPGNLTPKNKDRFTGLSFSTIPMPGAAKTTIEELNATGVVFAIQDGPTHVSVRPLNGTMDDWIKQGSDSKWTKAVKSVVWK